MEWITVSENNCRGYYLERSDDLKEWQSICFISSQSANGFSEGRLDYQYTDENVFGPTGFCHRCDNQNAIFYYRLLQQDHNGRREQIGEIRTIRSSNSFEEEVALYPNPASDIIYLRGKSLAQTYEIMIVDSRGRKQLSGNFKSGEVIDIKTLSPGNYRLILQDIYTGRNSKSFTVVK